MNKNSRILITGVAGFIGSNLANRLLQEGYSVVGIDDLSYGVKEQIPSGVEFHKLDIRSKDIYQVFNGIDFVFHLAAKNCIADCQQDPVETSDINVTGTVNVFEAASRANVKKVVYAESSALYEGIGVFPTPETQVAPRSFYAISKAGESFFAEGYQKFKGLTTIGLRYFNVYGPRQDYRRSIPPVMSAFIIKLLKRERPVIYGNGEKKRDFIHVDDINDFHLLCLHDARVDNKIFNLGSGKNYSVKDIYQKISEILSSKIEPEFKPSLEGEAETTLADISFAKSVGWMPKTTIDEGLKDMVGFIQSEIKAQKI
jgi:UDP-glucose 4-epimerase